MAAPVRAFPWARFLLGVAFLGAVALVGLTVAGVPPSAWWAVGILLGMLGVVNAGVFVAQLGLFARPVVAADPAGSGDRLALTFDDGPQPGATEEILALLAARGHRATFFVIGARAEVRRDLLERIVREGHALGNHSFAHRHTTPFLRPRALAEELARAEALFASVRPAGAPPGRWFRPPIGIVSPRVAQAARLAGLELVSWTASAKDGIARATVEGALARLRPHLRPGSILVLHDGAERGDREPIAPRVLARLLDELERRQLRSVTLDELLA